MKTALASIKSKLKVVVPPKIRYVDMIGLTEYADYILNALKVYYSVESLRKDITAAYQEEMNKKMFEMADICHYFSHYDTAERVEKLIHQYAPVLKGIYQTPFKRGEQDLVYN
jgi:hypothetical protein